MGAHAQEMNSSAVVAADGGRVSPRVLVASAVVAVVGCGAAAYLWHLITAAGTPAAFAHVELPRGLMEPSPPIFYRELATTDAGSLTAEFCSEDGVVRLRHTPRGSSDEISSWSGDLGFGVADVLLAPNDPKTLLVYGQAVSDATAVVVMGLIRFDLPLSAETVTVDRSFECSNDAKIRRHCEGAAIPSDSDYMLAAMRIGGELAQGLPPRHTETTRISFVREVQFHCVNSPMDNAGNYSVDTTLVMELSGEVLVDAGATVSVEVGQMQSALPAFQAQLAVDGGPLADADFSVWTEPAVPEGWDLQHSSVDKRVSHLLIKLPDGAREFELKIRHSDSGIHSGLQTWYFGVQDFGRQLSIAEGYEAYVLWNQPLLTRSMRSMPQSGVGLDLQLIDSAPDDVGRYMPRELAGQPLSGFHVRTAPEVADAFAIYLPEMR